MKFIPVFSFVLYCALRYIHNYIRIHSNDIIRSTWLGMLQRLEEANSISMLLLSDIVSQQQNTMGRSMTYISWHGFKYIPLSLSRISSLWFHHKRGMFSTLSTTWILFRKLCHCRQCFFCMTLVGQDGKWKSGIRG